MNFNNSKKRDSNIELLRLLAGCSVVILHFNYFGEGVGALYSAKGINYSILFYLEILCVPAVNVFILISGYYNSFSKEIKWYKLFKICAQLIIFNLIYKIIQSIINKHIDIKGILLSFLPNNYYVVLYVTLMLIAPFINLLIDKLSYKDTKILLVLLISIFSIYTILTEVFNEISFHISNGISPIGISGADSGYTIINFILVYLIGVYLRKYGTPIKKQSHIILLILFCQIIILLWRILLPNTAFYYCNPFIIGEAFFLFKLFLGLKISNKLINYIAPASFTCFLIHGWILSRFSFDNIVEKNSFLMLLILSGIIILVYIISIILMKLWDCFFYYIFRKTKESHRIYIGVDYEKENNMPFD